MIDKISIFIEAVDKGEHYFETVLQPCVAKAYPRGDL